MLLQLTKRSYRREHNRHATLDTNVSKLLNSNKLGGPKIELLGQISGPIFLVSRYLDNRLTTNGLLRTICLPLFWAILYRFFLNDAFRQVWHYFQCYKMALFWIRIDSISIQVCLILTQFCLNLPRHSCMDI